MATKAIRRMCIHNKVPGFSEEGVTKSLEKEEASYNERNFIDRV